MDGLTAFSNIKLLKLLIKPNKAMNNMAHSLFIIIDWVFITANLLLIDDYKVVNINGIYDILTPQGKIIPYTVKNLAVYELKA